jgi:hypothetical protein
MICWKRIIRTALKLELRVKIEFLMSMTINHFPSQVRVSISLGCYDTSQCDDVSYGMQQFSDSPQTTIVDPLKSHIYKWREERALNEVGEYYD